MYMLPACLLRMRNSGRDGTPLSGRRSAGRYAYLLAIPLVMVVNILCNLEAYRLTLAINVVSVKRLSSLFSVLLAWSVLKEEHIGQRMVAAAIMVIGVLWVGFAP